MSTTKILTVCVIALVAGLGLLIANQFGLIGTQATTPTGGTGGTGGTGISVTSEPDSVTLTWNDYNLEDRSIDPASLLRVYNPDKNNISDDATSTFAPNIPIDYIAGWTSTGYYAEDGQTNSGNKGENVFTLGLARAGALTITKLNKDSVTKNVATDRQAIGASEDDSEFKVTYDVASLRYWGAPKAPGASILACSFNTSEIATVTTDVFKSVAPFPTFVINSSLLGQSAYYVDNLANGAEKKFSILVDATSTEPENGAVQCNLVDANVIFDEQSLAVLRNVQDANGNRKSLAMTNFTIYYS